MGGWRKGEKGCKDKWACYTLEPCLVTRTRILS